MLTKLRSVVNSSFRVVADGSDMSRPGWHDYNTSTMNQRVEQSGFLAQTKTLEVEDHGRRGGKATPDI
jgi:hypothetical protein